jgi:glycosyltransferase involved in cell wall biosynthesis
VTQQSNADVVIVIPCYNEERRLPEAELARLLRRPGVRVLLVDDGSTDGTLARLRELERRYPGGIEALALPQNRGKAEAVRAGLGHALAGGADVVAYADADMATPAGEVVRLVEVLLASGANAVLGSRVALLGADIQRKHSRHYLGRVFATVASAVLRAPVYDTQCGAKVFRGTEALAQALATPFHSRWAFDVELIGRLAARAGGVRAAGIIEEPLRRWLDVDGSKIRPLHMVRAGLDLAIIEWHLRALRRD